MTEELKKEDAVVVAWSHDGRVLCPGCAAEEGVNHPDEADPVFAKDLEEQEELGDAVQCGACRNYF